MSRNYNFESIQRQFNEQRELKKEKEVVIDEAVATHNLDINAAHYKLLAQVRKNYQSVYEQIGLPGRKNKTLIDECLSVYVPNVMNAFPILMDTVETLRNRIEYLESENVKLYEERKNAYKALGWPIATRELNFHDTAPINKDDLFESYKKKRRKRKNTEPQQES